MANQQQSVIVAGPSREELFDALRLRHEKRQVTFTTARPDQIFKATVDRIGVEDGSGDNWLISLQVRDTHLGSVYLHGFYNTVRRDGWLRPTKKS